MVMIHATPWVFLKIYFGNSLQVLAWACGKEFRLELGVVGIIMIFSYSYSEFLFCVITTSYFWICGFTVPSATNCFEFNWLR
jgi:hypothetical protein